MSQHVGTILPGAGLETRRSIDSAYGVVLVPEIQPGPHQIYTMGLDVTALFATPVEAGSLFYSYM